MSTIVAAAPWLVAAGIVIAHGLIANRAMSESRRMLDEYHAQAQEMLSTHQCPACGRRMQFRPLTTRHVEAN